MNNIAFVQARMGSSRLPGKVMMRYNGLPLIHILLQRLAKSKKIDKIVVATTNSKEDKILINYIKKIGFPTFAGSNNNVIDRIYKAAKKFNAKNVIRITGDCPFIDHEVVDEVIKSFENSNYDYASNTNPPTFPDGLDVEVFSFKILKKTIKSQLTKYEKEHVTPSIINNKSYKKINYRNKKDLSNYRLTLDQIEDYRFISKIFNYFDPNIYFSWKQIIKLLKQKPSFLNMNQKIKRNQGSKIGSGQKLWIRAKNVIPGANMFISKRSEMFLPEKWPSYYSRAKGCNIWDLDNNKYIDMSLMGVGTNILGYNHAKINDSVNLAVKKGNMTTLNCAEEVYLAEKLINIHPWSEMVKFARTGGEANSIAIRIARAATGKDKIAFCGYHGWHDWYLSSVLKNKNNLSEHLIKGLKSKGVPKNLQSTAFPFKYNDIKGLEKIMLSIKGIGIIKMEVQRNNPPENNFLQKVRQIADKYKCILIFDECTSGFRQNFGGIHKIYNVYPDIATFGKALGNGYAITGVLGTKDVMNYAQDSFMSSTFWSERIGPTAGLATLREMEKIKSWEMITKKGNYIRKVWQELADFYNIKIKIGGLASLSNFVINSKNFQLYKTYITQEMLKKGFLASNSIYLCTKHSKKNIDEYLGKLEAIFKTINQCENGKDIKKLLKSPVSHKTFSRIN